MTRPSKALALAVAALAAATLFMVLPVGVDRSLIVWEPESADDGGSLRLTRTTPERVNVDTTCSWSARATTSRWQRWVSSRSP